MRVLTYHRPWPALILVRHCLAKTVENRPRRTRPGPHAIHAGRTWDPTAQQLAEHIGLPDGLVSWNPDDHPTGIVGTADIVDICDAAMLGYDCPEGCDRWAMAGCYHWRLRNARPVARVDMRGSQGWWTVSDQLLIPA